MSKRRKQAGKAAHPGHRRRRAERLRPRKRMACRKQVGPRRNSQTCLRGDRRVDNAPSAAQALRVSAGRRGCAFAVDHILDGDGLLRVAPPAECVGNGRALNILSAAVVNACPDNTGKRR